MKAEPPGSQDLLAEDPGILGFGQATRGSGIVWQEDVRGRMGLLEELHILDPWVRKQIHHSSSTSNRQSSLPFVCFLCCRLFSINNFELQASASQESTTTITSKYYSAIFSKSPSEPQSPAMAVSRDSIDDMHRDVLNDISYFEKYELPASPPETPPMKPEARMTLRERNSIHQSFEKAFLSSPSQSPRMGLKRTFSSQSAFGLPMTPPATPPLSSRVDLRPAFARTVSDSVNKSLGHQISYVSPTSGLIW